MTERKEAIAFDPRGVVETEPLGLAARELRIGGTA